MAVLHKNTYKLKFLLEGLEFYKDTQMKAFNITKLTAELKSCNSVQCIDYCYCFVSVGIDRSIQKELHIHT